MNQQITSLKEQGLLPFITVAILLASGIGASAWATQTLGNTKADAEEAARPAQIEMIVLTTPECTDCFDIETELNALQSLPLEVASRRSVSYPSDEATELINTYDIKRLPSAILTGEIDKENVSASLDPLGERRNGALVWNSLNPVYVNVETGIARGRTDMTLITSASCPECTSADRLIANLRSMGVVESGFTTLEAGTADAQSLISTYGIRSLPAVLLSSDASLYSFISSSWQQIGRIAEDGTLIADLPAPPFVRTSDGVVEGRVRMTLLTDASCTQCYDPAIFNQILRNYGVAVSASSTIDVQSSQGSALIDRYNIAFAPTLILSEDVSAYPAITQAWNQVGTVEPDGTYVLRAIQNFGTHRNLETGALVTPSSTNQ